MAHHRAKARGTIHRNLISRRRFGCWLSALLILLAVLAFGLAYFEPIKDAAVEVLGDEARDRLLAFYSGATSIPPETEDLAPIAHTGLNPFGVNVFLEQEVEESEIRRSLQMIKDAGFGWVKQQVLWSEIEIPAKGTYVDEKNGVSNTWAKYDRIVDLVQEYDLNLIARLDTSPDWARPGASKIETPPASFEDFGDFVYEIVSRYKGRVRYYIIWNEPNTAFEWGNRRVDAGDYTRMLKTAYLRARQADPDVVILSAALAPTIEVSERAVSDVIYLQQMYDAGAKDYFDIMSANPYGLRSGPYDRRLDSDKDVNFSRPILIREVMVRNGDAAKPVWASEMGWNALPPDFPQEPLFGRVTREQQARYTVDGLRRILEEWPWMGVVNLWHFRRVHPVNQNEQMYYFGLVGQDFTPFPVYGAVGRFAKSRPVAFRGLQQEAHWAVQYSGSWQTERNPLASLGAHKASTKAGDSVRFVFKGSKLSLILPKGPKVGNLGVSLDGGPPSLLPKDESGRAVIDLYSDREMWRQVVPVANGLNYGEHVVEIVALPDRSSSGDLKWYFDAFVVDGKPTNLFILVWPLLAALSGAIVGLAIARVALATATAGRSNEIN